MVTAEPGTEFRWQVGGKLVIWAYLLAPVEGGTELTETWELNEATESFFAEKYGEDAQAQLDQRREQARTGIPETLARIKEIVES